MPFFTVQRASITFDQITLFAETVDEMLDLVEGDDNMHVMRIDNRDGETVWSRQGLVVLPRDSKGVITP